MNAALAPGGGAGFEVPAAKQQFSDTLRLALASLLLLLVPFIQLGVSYWISVHGLMFWIALLVVRKRLSPMQALLLIGISLTMFASIAGAFRADTLFYAFLRVVRQSLCLFLIVSAATSMSWNLGRVFFERLLPLVVLSLSLLVVLQYVTLTFLNWTYLFVPARWYVEGFSTLADAWLQFGADRGIEIAVRPSGTFAEPSYFGFVCLCLAMLVLKGVHHHWLKIGLLASMLIALLCSKSASGASLYVLLVLFAYRRRLSVAYLSLGVLGVALAFIGAEIFLDFHLIERILNVTDPVKEPSGYIRLILPLKHIILVLENRPLGVPLTELYSFVSRHLDSYSDAGLVGPLTLRLGMVEGLDNGLFNLFIMYGFGGFVIIGLLWLLIRDPLALVFMLFVAQFNGDMLSPDKAVMLALALGCHRLGTSPAAERKARRPKPIITSNAFGATFAFRR